jgi:hypothetical protein
MRDYLSHSIISRTVSLKAASIFGAAFFIGEPNMPSWPLPSRTNEIVAEEARLKRQREAKAAARAAHKAEIVRLQEAKDRRDRNQPFGFANSSFAV